MPRPPKRLSLPEVTAAVLALYRDVDARPVDRQCVSRSQCCRFQLTGRTPFLTRGEALVAAKAWRATGRIRLPENSGGACPLLDAQTARCRIYAHRPFGCRTHFCAAAGGPYTRREVIDLIHELEEIDRALGGEGPRPLPAAVDDALRDLA